MIMTDISFVLDKISEICPVHQTFRSKSAVITWFFYANTEPQPFSQVQLYYNSHNVNAYGVATKSQQQQQYEGTAAVVIYRYYYM